MNKTNAPVMAFLFWLLWSFDVLLLAISVAGGIFRGNLHLQNPFTSIHFWGISLGSLAVIGGLLLRYALKMPRGSLLLVALPMVMVLILYLVDRK